MDQSGFATVAFATPSGTTHKQRVTYAGEGPSQLIPRAAKGCKRKGVVVANVLEIRRGAQVLFAATADLRLW